MVYSVITIAPLGPGRHSNIFTENGYNYNYKICRRNQKVKVITRICCYPIAGRIPTPHLGSSTKYYQSHFSAGRGDASFCYGIKN